MDQLTHALALFERARARNPYLVLELTSADMGWMCVLIDREANQRNVLCQDEGTTPGAACVNIAATLEVLLQ
jgi:hypothetical protein